MTPRKALTFGALAFFLSVVFMGLQYLGSRAAPVYTIESEINLAANPERSWQVLTDFEKYPDWNPYATRIEGEFAEGATLSFTVVDANFESPLDLQATLGEIRPPESFHWVGVVLMRGIHDTRHGFSLRPLEDGSAQLRHYEEFRGILPMVLPGRQERVAKTKASFEKMNEALRARLRPSA